MVRLTVSGHPGSGTSTLVVNICGRRNWRSLNGGEVFRALAEERDVAVEEFSELCKQEPEVDKSLDDRLLQEMQNQSGPEVIESRLSGWWAYNADIDCVRLWLSVSESERARRVVQREGGSIDAALTRIRKRMARDQSRYSRLYGIDLDDMTPYNLVIESDKLSPQQVTDAVELALDSEG